MKNKFGFVKQGPDYEHMTKAQKDELRLRDTEKQHRKANREWSRLLEVLQKKGVISFNEACYIATDPEDVL